ncbi:MAG: efflux RND transporter periplasmic adaptor subunit [Bacteroidales bacterium]|nr:efflux RND transporter periplasmic adaptor subunit [Bacteroidales bacterium]
MKTKTSIALVLTMLTLSCTNDIDKRAEISSDLIEISKEQFQSEEMQIGVSSFHHFYDKVYFRGTIIPSPDGQAHISLPIPGIIKNISCRPAQIITKNTVLFEVSGHWLIDLQKDYSQSSALLSKLKSDYLRAKELHKENIGTIKDFHTIESAYLAENANNMALKTKLETIGLGVSRIEKGEFYASFPLKSPLDGFVATIHTSIGQHIGDQQIIAEVIDNSTFQLKLHIFEKDIQKIKIGQKISFYLNGNKTQKHQATITAIGKTIMPDSKAVECFATIDNISDIQLINNQFVEGEILTSLDSALSVPETAIISAESENYVLKFKEEKNGNLYFEKFKVKTGRKSDNYIEISGKEPLQKIVLSGTYNIVVE